MRVLTLMPWQLGALLPLVLNSLCVPMAEVVLSSSFLCVEVALLSRCLIDNVLILRWKQWLLLISVHGNHH